MHVFKNLTKNLKIFWKASSDRNRLGRACLTSVTSIPLILPPSLKAAISRVVLSQNFETLTKFIEKTLRFIVPN